MLSTKSRLQAMTAELVIPDFNAPIVVNEKEKPVESRFPPVGQRVGSKTGPGQMLEFRGQMINAEIEINNLKAKLGQYDDSMPARKLDPKSVEPSHWVNRHVSSYSTPQFLKLKDDISKSNGNSQAILVRPKEGREGVYEIVFGHRRHKACLELGIPVLAVICTDKISDTELFASMDRENRERADLSNFEQGMMYQKAIEEGLYVSKRNLAEMLGVSHTWVNSTLSVANLPVPIIECFKSPLEVTYRHAKLINEALERDRKQVLKRADKLRGMAFSTTDVMNTLLNITEKKSEKLVVNGRSVGKIERNGDTVLVRFEANLSEEKIEKVQVFIRELLK